MLNCVASQISFTATPFPHLQTAPHKFRSCEPKPSTTLNRDPCDEAPQLPESPKAAASRRTGHRGVLTCGRCVPLMARHQGTHKCLGRCRDYDFNHYLGHVLTRGKKKYYTMASQVIRKQKKGQLDAKASPVLVFQTRTFISLEFETLLGFRAWA